MKTLFVAIPVLMSVFFIFALGKEIYDYLQGKMSGLACSIVCTLHIAAIVICWYYLVPLGFKLMASGAIAPH